MVVGMTCYYFFILRRANSVFFFSLKKKKNFSFKDTERELASTDIQLALTRTYVSTQNTISDSLPHLV